MRNLKRANKSVFIISAIRAYLFSSRNLLAYDSFSKKYLIVPALLVAVMFPIISLLTPNRALATPTTVFTCTTATLNAFNTAVVNGPSHIDINNSADTCTTLPGNARDPSSNEISFGSNTSQDDDLALEVGSGITEIVFDGNNQSNGFAADLTAGPHTIRYREEGGTLREFTFEVINVNGDDQEQRLVTTAFNIVQFDETAPTVTVDIIDTALNDTDNSSVVNFTFSEAVENFIADDLTVVGGTISGFTFTDGTTSGSATFTATDGITTTGSVSVDANSYQDLAGNDGATGSDTVTIDTENPTVAITTDSGGSFNESAPGTFTATVTFSEAVTGFVDGELTATNATVGALSPAGGAGTIFTATITPAGTGNVALNVAANVAQDTADNDNTAAPQITVIQDNDVVPTVAITTDSGGSFNESAPGTFTATVTFSEAVTGFVDGELTATNATVGALSPAGGAGTIFTATITPAGTGNVALNVAANVAQDTADNDNTAAPQITVTQDSDVVPTVAITTDSGGSFTQSAPGTFIATVTFSEAVTGFVDGELTATNAAVGALAPAGGADTIFTATITPAGTGDIALNVAANVAQDADGNDNIAAPQVIVTQVVTNPEIGISSSVGGALLDPATDAQGVQIINVPVIVTYTITNTGTAQLDLTNAAPTLANASNVGTPTIGNYSSTMLAAGGGTTTFVVTYTPQAVGAFSFELDVLSNDADEATFDILVSGTGALGAPAVVGATSGTPQTTPAGDAFGAPLVATVTDSAGNPIPGEQVFFTAPTSGASGTFAGAGTTLNVVTDANGVATTSALTANGTAGTFSVTATVAGLTPASFSLTNNNNRDSLADIETTRRVVNNFITTRANEIISSDFDLSDRLTRSGTSAAGNPIGFAALGEQASFALSFDTSLSGLRRQLAQQGIDSLTGNALGVASTNSPAAGDKFDVWIKGRYSRIENETRTSDLFLVYFGADFKVTDTAVLGATVQVDITDEQDETLNIGGNGTGWLAGPYFAAKVAPNVTFEARAAAGQSYNDVDALGLGDSSFTTNRFLGRVGVTGDFRHDNLIFRPNATLLYFGEQQQEFVDNLGNTIPGQSIEFGRFSIDPEVRYEFTTEDGLFISPFFSAQGIWDFLSQPLVNVQTGIATDTTDDPRVRFEGGVSVRTSRGATVEARGFFDGVGQSDFRAYGGSLQVRVPF